jgi:ribonuclease PH
MTPINRRNRQENQIRKVTFISNYTKHAQGSVLASFGDTKVICTATVTEGVPRFLRDSQPKQGWLTAEYSMLPSATNTRNNREAARGKVSGRTQEIQRLIGRSLRSCLNLRLISDLTINIDCDVIQADGGTRTTAISGAYVALVQAMQHLQYEKIITTDPIISQIAAVSVGVVGGIPMLDLDYNEDSAADTDMNVVMNDKNQYIEIQGTAEKKPFSQKTLSEMLNLAKYGAEIIFHEQHQAINQKQNAL